MRNQRTHILPRLVLAGLTLLTTLLLSAPSALASEGCPNEAVRTESNINPTTHEPYDMGLPECRAYEMVSPLEKQQHDAVTVREPSEYTPIASNGDSIKWEGQGDYAGAENYQTTGSGPTNPYVADRTASGWVTRSAYPPPSIIAGPLETFGNSAGVMSESLATETVCGTPTVTGAGDGPSVSCAVRMVDGEWLATPAYTDLTNEYVAKLFTLGASRSGDVYLFHGAKGAPFVAADTSSLSENCQGEGECGGIYAVTGIGTQAPALHLVNVDSEGNMIGAESGNAVGAIPSGSANGAAYQAISADGSTISFTATPNGGVPTLYARRDYAETVTVSAPECEGKCAHEESEPATYQGAALNSKKIFFTSQQQLMPMDADETLDLYEYNFGRPAGHGLRQVSAGGLGDVTPGSGARVRGVVAVSEDGSHVYFVAEGVLTSLPNGVGQVASEGADNLYAFNTDDAETKFVATLGESDKQLWGESETAGRGTFDTHLAQATPNGRYLAFDTFQEVIGSGPEADTSGAQQVYRYDDQTGKIIRVSTGHQGFAENGNVPGYNAVIAPANARGRGGAEPTANEVDRAISENGQTIAFVTAARLQNTDEAGGANTSCNNESPADSGAGCEVYVWHECSTEACGDGNTGEVAMVSDGQNPKGTVYLGMSATGSDVFFQTPAQLVPADTDQLGDIYDARIDGGFPAPSPEASCSGEACQGTQSSSPTFGTPGSQSFTGGGNQVAPPFKEVLEPKAKRKSKPLTNAQKLTRALKVCRRDRFKARRVACERASRKRFGPKPRAKRKR
ncbi:MAG TPA: hypothetical protein VII53_07135 [Solirubrobacteraceae bacterium]